MKKESKIMNSANSIRSSKRQSHSMGFTLIEMMIVVALIAIIATIALPSFIDSVRKARRADAQQGLMEAAHALENYYARNAGYPDNASNTADLRLVGFNNAEWNDIRAGSDTAYYEISLLAETGGCDLDNCFTLQARPKAGSDQESDAVCWFTLWSTGRKQMNIDTNDDGVCESTKDGWKR